MPILQPQPTTVPGRPDIPNAEVAKQLRNIAPLPLGAPEDKLPVSQLKRQSLRPSLGERNSQRSLAAAR
jgi:hypothetical protein